MADRSSWAVSRLLDGLLRTFTSKRYVAIPFAVLHLMKECIRQSLESRKKKHNEFLDVEADLRVADETGIDTDLPTDRSEVSAESQTTPEERPGIKEILASPVVRGTLLSYGSLAFVAVCHDAIWALW